MEIQEAQSRQLEYGVPPRRFFRKKSVRLGSALLAAAGLLIALKQTQFIARSGLLWDQWRCMSYTDDSSVPVYGVSFEDKRMAQLLASSSQLKGINKGRGTVRAGRVPACWQRLSRHPEIAEREPAKGRPEKVALAPEGTIFLGTLTSPNGQSKLVAINVTPSSTNSDFPVITAHIITPAGLNTPPLVKRQLFNFGPHGDNWYRGELRIYPARTDRRNDAKCEAGITYETYLWEVRKYKMWEEKLICELQDDGSIKLSTAENNLIPEKYWAEAYHLDDF
jgi:hypothetical protein